MRHVVSLLRIAAFFVFYGQTALGQIITTVAGGGSSGIGDGGAAISCELKFPRNTAVDASGNLYVVDEGNNLVRKVNTAGIITTIAGNGTQGYNGDNIPATDAELGLPYDIA